MTNKTFREQYKDQKFRAVYFFGWAFVYMIWGGFNCYRYDTGIMEVALFITSAVFYFLGWDSFYRMKKAKRYIIFDDFLKQDQL